MNINNLRCEYMINPIGIDTLNPRMSWVMESEKRCAVQTAYQILVSTSEMKLANNDGDLWDSGKVPAGASAQIAYNGKDLKSSMCCWWKVRVWDEEDMVSSYSDMAYWEMGLLCENDWIAKWIGIDRQFILKDNSALENVGLPSPYLRKTFTIKKAIRSARIYSTSLGVYEVYLNGMKVGDDVLAPGWTDYNIRIQYQSYDAKELLSSGENTIGAILGDGWYTGNIAITGRCQYGDYPLLLLLQLRIEYMDNTVEYIVSDGTWKGNTGPILYSDMQMGEYYDARKELHGWCNQKCDDTAWLPVSTFDHAYKKLATQIGPAVKVMKELRPVAKKCIQPDTYIFDIGQNMVGRALLKVSGKAGTKIKLRFGEMLNRDGSLYTENLRTAAQTDIYILKGDGIEYYEPKFTFHGFRYIEVTGYPGEPGYDAVTGRVVYSAMKETISFKCSNEMVNQLQSNIFWGQRGNFLSIPTDCPQRDERMGWTGDGQIFARTACFNMDCSGFLNKWMKDIADTQQISGAFTDVAPFVRKSDGEGLVGYGNAAWADAGVIIPWTLYLCYGDVRVLKENYEAMSRYIEYLLMNSDNFIRPNSGFGDWLSIDADTPKDLMGTAYFAYSTSLLAKIARILGNEPDVQKYEKLFENIKSAFNKEYVSESGRVEGETQTCYLLAIKAGLLSEEKRLLAVRHLVNNLEERGCHISTGFVGVSYLLPVLSDAGFTDIAYRLLLCETYPSWLYSIKNGATTIWERWNSYTIEEGFGDVNMNSFNHYSFGSVGEWLYRYMAGIDTDIDKPGYKNINIKPHPGGNISYVKAEYESIHGTVKCYWSKDERTFRLNVTIPANTTATLCIPFIGGSIITEGGIPINEVKEIQFLRIEDGYAIIKTGSGSYEFECLET